MTLLRFGVRAVAVVAAVTSLFTLARLTNLSPLPNWSVPLQLHQPDNDHHRENHDGPRCRKLTGGEDVVVVMRTGATEIKDKLPIHLATTFQCYPDTLIFSDLAEVFQGHQVHDVLAAVDDRVKETNGDFAHYLRLQRLGREGFDQSELSDSSYESGPVGKNDNAGWRLDKWKFLPMMVRTLEFRPDKKWYVFVEPDTYLVWSNLLQWLQKLDPSKPFYSGSEVQIGEDIFAHGGSAFVMSRSAIQKGAELYTSEPDEWHTRTSQHWAGDCILGTALQKAGVGMAWGWPMFQGGNPADMNWADAKVDRIKLLWCGPAISYHHFDPDQVQDMWEFEQRWIRNSTAPRSRFWQRRKTVLYHSDTFLRYVMPNLTSERADWSNSSPELIPNSRGLTAADCRASCEAKTSPANETCVQYALSEIGCSLSSDVKMGKAAKGVRSGWIMDRVEAWLDGLEECGSRAGWTVT